MEDVSVSMCNFNIMLHHITWTVSVAVQKWSWALDQLRTWSSSFLACTLSWLESCRVSFCGGASKPKSVPVQLIQGRNCGTELKNLHVKWKIHLESSSTCEFLFHTELNCMSMNIEVILCSRCKKVKVKRLVIACLFVFLLYTAC